MTVGPGEHSGGDGVIQGNPDHSLTPSEQRMVMRRAAMKGISEEEAELELRGKQ